MRNKIDEIETKFAVETDFESLNSLEVELNAIESCTNTNFQIAMLRGRILQRKGEWARAARCFAYYSAIMPEQIELVYEAALNFIDAGIYDKAYEFLITLSKQVESLSDAHLRGVWRAATLLAEHDLAGVAHSIALDRNSPFASNLIARRIEIAKNNSVKNLPLVVSIGENCLPWMMANRWGYRTKIQDYKHQSVFNLAQTSSKAVAYAIRNGLKGLVGLDNLETKILPNGTPIPYNKIFDFNFNHEQGRSFIDDDFSALQKLYNTRIASFASTMSSNRCVYFHYVETDFDPIDIFEAIRDQRKNEDYIIIVLNSTGSVINLPDQISKKLFVRNVELPRTNYLWFKPSDYESTEGFYFEQRLVASIDEAIKFFD